MGVTVTPTTVKQATGPRSGAGQGGDEASDLGDSMEEWKALPASGSSASATSVDTDVDKVVDDTDDELAAEGAVQAAVIGAEDTHEAVAAAFGAEALPEAVAIGAEDTHEIVAAASDEEALPRAAAGSFVTWRNDHVSISYHGQDIRMRKCGQWCSDTEMGTWPQARVFAQRPTARAEADAQHARSSCEPGLLRAWRLRIGPSGGL